MTYYKAIITENCPAKGQTIGSTLGPKSQYYNMTREQLEEAVKKNTVWGFKVCSIMTDYDKDIICDQLSNNENASDEEIVEFLREVTGLEVATLTSIVKTERPEFFRNMSHSIDFTNY